jgi:glucose-6-phosphate 1-dehydrogenase
VASFDAIKAFTYKPIHLSTYSPVTYKPTNMSPAIVFIFGGSGDLAKRKLLPALYNLYLDKYIPEELLIVGTGRSDYSDATYRSFIKEVFKSIPGARSDLTTIGKNFQNMYST